MLKFLKEASSKLWISTLFKSGIVFLVSVIFLYSQKTEYAYLSDEGIYTYGAIRILKGQVLYKDFFSSNSPLNFYLLSTLYYLFGTDTMVSVWTTIIMLSVISVLVFIISREINFSEPLSYLMSLFFIVGVSTKFFLYSHHWVSNLFMFCSIFFLIKFYKQSHPLFLLLCGLFSGLTALSFYPKGILLLYGIITCILVYSEKRIKSLLFLFFSFSFPVVFFLINFLLHNSIPAFIRQSILWPVKNYNVLHRYPSYYYPVKIYLLNAIHGDRFLSALFRSLSNLLIGYNLFIATGIVIGVGLLSRIELFIKRKKELTIYFLTLFIFISTLYRPDDLRLAIISPLTQICLFASLSLFDELRIKKTMFLKKFLLLLFLSIILFEIIKGITNEVMAKLQNKIRSTELSTPRGLVYINKDLLKYAMEINQLTKDVQEKIFIYPCVPSIYYLWDRENPTRYDCIFPFYNTQKEFDELINELRVEKVNYVLFFAYYLFHDEQYFPIKKEIEKGRTRRELENLEPMIKFLKEEYEPIYRFDYVQQGEWSDYLGTLYRRKQQEEK